MGREDLRMHFPPWLVLGQGEEVAEAMCSAFSQPLSLGPRSRNGSTCFPSSVQGLVTLSNKNRGFYIGGFQVIL